ncbi:Spore germination protein B3 precursor [Pelotomaculum schinkii]|uniref:Spore germination protein B3 n=1 Tax=Pelotomaculum schinkii TaxID=78350 RepID=A0A4Y7RG72_9FIRM|nr:Ger(x)C family spore germination protein [Pelotomaculum schinkii]TEB07327.1 Spore germination protein B3 precursor [Pelotomaculum schinkii]
MGKGLKCLALCALIVVTALSLQGCWDQQEVERLGIVLTTAIDLAPDGRVMLTVQVVNPKSLVGGGVGGVGGVGGGVGGARGFRNVSVEGSTIFDCIRLLSLESPRELYFAHNMAIMISEEFARNRGIEEIMDFFERNPQIRRNNYVLIARSDISSILETPGELVPPPSQVIASTIRQQRLSSYYPDVQLGDFLETLETEGSDAYAAGIQVEPNEAEVRDKISGSSSLLDGRPKPIGAIIKIGGTAVFKGNKMAGWLDERESRGLLWVKGRVKGGVITVPCISGEGGVEGPRFSLEIIRNASKIQPELTEGELGVTVRVDIQANILEAECPEELDKPEVIASIEQLLATAVQGEVEDALTKAQREYKADVFGFGTVFHRKYPVVWKEIKENWIDIYPGLPVYIEVNAVITRTGLVNKPAQVRR